MSRPAHTAPNQNSSDVAAIHLVPAAGGATGTPAAAS
jgi:hypothetical protein